MQNKISNFLFSTRLTAFYLLFLLLPWQSEPFWIETWRRLQRLTQETLIYNAWWFEAIILFFVINFSGNIFRYRLYVKEKWATFTLHLSFILIIIGHLLHRYIGFEGMMPITEGDTENTFLSQKTYVTAYIDGDYKIDGSYNSEDS